MALRPFQNKNQNTDTELESLEIVHNQVKSFWSKHETEFTQWWSQQLDNEAKLAFLLEVSPISPQLGYTPTPFDITPHVTPEMIPEALCDLPSLFREFTFVGEGDLATPAIHTLGWNRSAFAECSLGIVAVGQLAFLRSQIRKGLLLDKLNKYPNHFIALLGQNLQFGSVIERTKQPIAGVSKKEHLDSQRQLDKYREAGVCCYMEEWNLIRTRLYMIINTLGVIADEFKSDQLGKESSGMKTIKANIGCSVCGKHQCNSGTSLKSCSCKITFYCSNECQSSDWENHKVKHYKEVALLKGCGNCKFEYHLRDSSISLKFCPCERVAYCSAECHTMCWSEHKADHNKYIKKSVEE